MAISGPAAFVIGTRPKLAEGQGYEWPIVAASLPGNLILVADRPALAANPKLAILPQGPWS